MPLCVHPRAASVCLQAHPQAAAGLMQPPHVSCTGLCRCGAAARRSPTTLCTSSSSPTTLLWACCPSQVSALKAQITSPGAACPVQQH